MSNTVKLEDRELTTIAHLLYDRLQRGAESGSAYDRRSLVRLALVLTTAGGAYGGWKNVIRQAPAWVYAYLGKPIIDLTPKAKPKARRAARPRPGGSAAARPGARRTTAATADEEE